MASSNCTFYLITQNFIADPTQRYREIASLMCSSYLIALNCIRGSDPELSQRSLFVGWLVGGLTSQRQASVSQERICTDNFTCCHTEIEVADQTLYLTQSQYTDTGQTSPSADPIMPGTWQRSHWSAWYDSTRKNPVASRIRTPDLPLQRRTP